MEYAYFDRLIYAFFSKRAAAKLESRSNVRVSTC